MKKSGKLGLITIVVTLVIALIVVWRLYPMGAVSESAVQSSAIPSTAPATAGSNAADRYRRAFALVQSLQENPAQSAQLGRYEEGEFDKDAAAFFKQHKSIIDEVKAGAAAAGCDWGEPVMEKRLPTLNGLRTIANFTLTHAQFAATQKESAVVLDDSLAAMALARHVGADGLLVDKFVELGVELKAIDRLAAGLPLLTNEQLKSLPARLDALPKSATGRQMMDAEFAFAKRSIRDQQGGMVATAMADGLEDFYRNIGAVMDEQSPQQFAATVDAEMAKVKLNTFAQVSGKSFARVREPLAVLQVKRAMLRAAIDIRVNGESALASWRDPFGEGPFGYVKTADGFELTSKLTQRDAAVKLSVGEK